MLVGGKEADSNFIIGYLEYYSYWHWILEHGTFNHSCDYLFLKSPAFAEIDPVEDLWVESGFNHSRHPIIPLLNLNIIKSQNVIITAFWRDILQRKKKQLIIMVMQISVLTFLDFLLQFTVDDIVQIFPSWLGKFQRGHKGWCRYFIWIPFFPSSILPLLYSLNTRPHKPPGIAFPFSSRVRQ